MTAEMEWVNQVKLNVHNWLVAPKSHKLQRGDTIVEVLIAVAVVGAVLAGAFTVSQKSVIAIRNSQEHGEMLQILQSQVEIVRSLALDTKEPNAGVFAPIPKFFCMDETTKNKLPLPSSTTVLPPIEEDNFSTYGQCRFGMEDRYNVAITYDSNKKIFTFVGRWDRIGGGKNQEQLAYRVYPTL